MEGTGGPVSGNDDEELQYPDNSQDLDAGFSTPPQAAPRENINYTFSPESPSPHGGTFTPDPTFQMAMTSPEDDSDERKKPAKRKIPDIGEEGQETLDEKMEKTAKKQKLLTMNESDESSSSHEDSEQPNPKILARPKQNLKKLSPRYTVGGNPKSKAAVEKDSGRLESQEDPDDNITLEELAKQQKSSKSDTVGVMASAESVAHLPVQMGGTHVEGDSPPPRKGPNRRFTTRIRNPHMLSSTDLLSLKKLQDSSEPRYTEPMDPGEDREGEEEQEEVEQQPRKRGRPRKTPLKSATPSSKSKPKTTTEKKKKEDPKQKKPMADSMGYMTRKPPAKKND